MARLDIAKGKSDLFWLDPEDIDVITDKYDPLYDERVEVPPSEAFILNVLARGVDTPLRIRRDGPRVQAVFGRKRRAAAIEANRRLRARGLEPMRVPCVLWTGSDADALGSQISENECRVEDGPLVKARKVQRFMAFGKTRAEAATVFGVEAATIDRYLQLLDLAPEVQAAVDDGRLTATAARPLASIERAKQVEALAEATRGAEACGRCATEGCGPDCRCPCHERARAAEKDGDSAAPDAPKKIGAAALSSAAKKRGARAGPVAVGKRDIRDAIHALDQRETKQAELLGRVLRWVLGEVGRDAVPEIPEVEK